MAARLCERATAHSCVRTRYTHRLSSGPSCARARARSGHCIARNHLFSLLPQANVWAIRGCALHTLGRVCVQRVASHMRKRPAHKALEAACVSGWLAGRLCACVYANARVRASDNSVASQPASQCNASAWMRCLQHARTFAPSLASFMLLLWSCCRCCVCVAACRGSQAYLGVSLCAPEGRRSVRRRRARCLSGSARECAFVG